MPSSARVCEAYLARESIQLDVGSLDFSSPDGQTVTGTVSDPA
jgi:hypothetical protein